MSEFEKLKSRLDTLAESYREDITKQLGDLVQKLGKNGQNALIIGGSLLAAYLVVRVINGKSTHTGNQIVAEEEKGGIIYREIPVKRETFLNKLTGQLTEQLLVFVLTLAKEKLIEFLTENQQNADSKDD